MTEVQGGCDCLTHTEGSGVKPSSFTKKMIDMRLIIPTFFYRLILLICISGSLASCGAIYEDDLPECKTVTRLRFRYDYNMKHADAFQAEVRSLKVWAFDKEGRPVWSASGSGEELAGEDFYIDVPLTPGVYDFVAWCGLEGNDGCFSLTSEEPSQISDLGVDMLLKQESRADAPSGFYIDSMFTGLYHAMKRDVEIYNNPSASETHEIELSLTKDTNYVKVLLQNLDGTEMKASDFSVSIVAGNSRLDHTNKVVAGSPEFSYRPWMTSEGQTSMTDDSGATITTVSAVLAELSTSRLVDKMKCNLKVVRNTDGKEIISIPLIQYLLLVKGHYDNMDNQEFLDRQDEHSLLFFLDKDHNWYTSAGIYVNAWHVVPPQDENLH